MKCCTGSITGSSTDAPPRSEGAQRQEDGRDVARRLEWGGSVGTTASEDLGYRQEVPQTVPYRLGDGATDGDWMGAARGDGRSQVGAHAKVGMPIAPAMQPLRRDAQEAIDSRDVGGSKPAGIAGTAGVSGERF